MVARPQFLQPTLKLLRCLAEMPFLSILVIDRYCFIEEEWIRLVLNAKPDFFTNLKTLHLRTSHAGFRLLEPNLERLEELTVKLRVGTPPLQFRAPYNMPHLKYLRLNLGSKGIIYGEELIGLATSCPQLTSIAIGESFNRPRCSGVLDSVIDTFVQLLPNLTFFMLYADGSALTEQALLHFGRHCKSIEQLMIPGDLNFIKLAKTGEPGLFPKLWRFEAIEDFIHIIHRERYFQTYSREEYWAVPSRISLIMPCLQDIGASVEIEFLDSPIIGRIREHMSCPLGLAMLDYLFNKESILTVNVADKYLFLSGPMHILVCCRSLRVLQHMASASICDSSEVKIRFFSELLE